MHISQGNHAIDGPSGDIEIFVDVPTSGVVNGVAIVCHPQPLLGGSAQHKVPHYLAKSLTEIGWLVFRPNFRGVGRSGGKHDRGDGEAQDIYWLAQQIKGQFPIAPVALIGVSFGAFVQAKVAEKLESTGQQAEHVVLSAMPWGEVEGGRTYDTPQTIANALVIHGELDERVPLASIFAWARSSTQVVSVIPGADHLFTGKLPVLKDLIVTFLQKSKNNS